MTRKRFLPVPADTLAGTSVFLKRRDIVCLCGVHPDLVERLERLGLIDRVHRDPHDGEPVFHREAVPLIEKVLRLRKELGINFAGVGVVLELLSRIEQLEARIRQLEAT